MTRTTNIHQDHVDQIVANLRESVALTGAAGQTREQLLSSAAERIARFEVPTATKTEAFDAAARLGIITDDERRQLWS